MPELLSLLLATCERPIALIVCLLLLFATGNARATNETRGLTGSNESYATLQTTVYDRETGAKADHVLTLAEPQRSTTGTSHSRAPISARGAPFEQTQVNATNHGFLKALGLYLAAGLMLAALPASLPVALILSAIVVNSSARITGCGALMLSLCYVAGSTVVYTTLGLTAASYEGASKLFLGSPPWLILFAILLIGLAIRLMADELIQLPPRWQRALLNVPTHPRKTIKYLAVAGVGALAALAVNADIMTRLASRLAVWTPMDGGGAMAMAMVTMSVGLALPLVALGSGIATIVRRAGSWMEGIRIFFAIEMLATALLIVWPFLDRGLQVAAGSGWLLVVIAELGGFSSRGRPGTIWRKPGRGIAAAVAIWTTILLAGPVSSPLDPQHLLQHLIIEESRPTVSTNRRFANASMPSSTIGRRHSVTRTAAALGLHLY
jgi:thiol:disulfide interchange protein DsbD